MAVSEAQKKASEKYKKENTKQYKLMLSLKYDTDIIAMLDSVENRQGYLKSLIRADIVRANSEKTKEEKTMKYTIKPEYIDLWCGSEAEADENTIVTEEDVARLAHDWETSEDELKSQLIPARANSDDEDEPAKWYIIDDARTARGEIFEKPIEAANLTEAIKAARKDWDYLTAKEQAAQNDFYVCRAKTDEDGCVDYDTMTDYYSLKNAAQNSRPVTFDGDGLTAPVFFDASARNDDDPGIPSGWNPWYAVQRDPEDDWDYDGSFDLEEAKAKARKLREEYRYPNALIAVIDNSLENPFCIEEIRDF